MPSRTAYPLPSFIGVGPARTGTTWIHEVLQPFAGLPRGLKETDFFSTNYDLGVDWYVSHFAGYAAGTVLGEITPTYFDHPEAPGRIAELLPRCRVIVSLREPVARLYSHYRLLRGEGWIARESFEETLRRHEKWADRAGNMIGVNRYSDHLQRWFDALGREQVLVVRFDDLSASPQQFIDQITAFVGLPGIDLSGTRFLDSKINPRERAPRNPHLAARARRLRDTLERRRRYRTLRALAPFFAWCAGRGEVFPPLSAPTAQMLRARFRPEIEALENLLGQDLSAWKRD